MVRDKIACLIAALAVNAGAMAQSVPLNAVAVDAMKPPGGDGLTWETAFDDLQDALAYVRENEQITQIWIANGTYAPGTGRLDSFELVDGVKVYGGFHGDAGTGSSNGEEKLSDRNIYGANTEVILSGEIGAPDISDNSHHVVKVTGDGFEMRLDGVTVTRGNANVEHIADEGGGIYADDARLILVNSTITDNNAGEADCVGGVQNEVSGTGGGLAYFESTGGENMVSGAEIFNCQFTDNYVWHDNCRGGAVYLDRIDIDIVNCLFARNGADASFCEGLNSRGGAIFTVALDASIVNCTFAENSVEAAFGNALGAAVYVGTGAGQPPTTIMTNCIVWANVPDTTALYPAVDLLEVNYSDIEEGWTGPGGNNIDADPMFVGNGDYRLDPDVLSPARDRGDNGVVPTDSRDLDDDTNTGERIPALNHAGRIQPPGGVVDMGAYETCDPPYDLDGDQFIGFDEILLVTSYWGQSCAPPSATCPDLDGDGMVGFDDLLIVLSYWGPCGNFGTVAPPQSVLDCLRLYGSQPAKFAKCVEAMMLAGTP